VRQRQERSNRGRGAREQVGHDPRSLAPELRQVNK
jgi:hypothetical protein